jgi:hypothetical protein
LLKASERSVLREEIERCSDRDTGFPYMARNYYWITAKDNAGGGDILLKFKETQEMVWETIRLLRSRGRQVKIIIIKGRQLYISSFCLGLMAYETQCNPNNRGLLVSYDEDHAASLFGIILHIYDQLPWWLRPMVGSRKYEKGIHLVNPDPELRRRYPGINSKIKVQGANQQVGVSEGETVNTAHISEFGSYAPIKARKIIMSDFRWALPDAPTTTAIVETRVQRASKFVEKLWESMVSLGDDADWYPLFIPIYFDKSHVMPPRGGWKPAEPELLIKYRAAEEWCACPLCGQIRPAQFGGGNVAGMRCRDCQKAPYEPYVLKDDQMRWLEHVRVNAEGIGESAVVDMQQSLATNPQEAFASATDTLFSKRARDWVSSTTRSSYLARGYLDSGKVFHAPRMRAVDHVAASGEQYGEESPICVAKGCKLDHRGEGERYLKLWQMPQHGVKYGLSADVGSGGGRGCDYSVIIVSKISQLPAPDIQVASYRCNSISPWHLATVVDAIGRWYNNALAIVDYTNQQACGDRLLHYYHYPNIFQWINADKVLVKSNAWHWTWNYKNKESGWQVLDGFLSDHAFIVKDETLAKEIRNYQRLADGTIGAPDAKADDGLGADFEKIYDDFVSAAIQLVIGCHQLDPRRPGDLGVPQLDGIRGPGAGEWIGICLNKTCKKEFPAQVPQERVNCPYCGSIWLKWTMPKAEEGPPLGFNRDDMGLVPGSQYDKEGMPEFTFGTSEVNNLYGE